MDNHSNNNNQSKVSFGLIIPVTLALVVITTTLIMLNTYGKCSGSQSCHSENKEETHQATAAVDHHAPVETPAVESKTAKIKLSSGTEFEVNKGGIEYQLYTFLSSNWKELSVDSLKKTWFNFDNLNFETGSAKITTESQKQIENIAAILKAFPDAKLKIGGYTDKVGNENANKKLSGERAKATLEAIKAAGVDEKQLTGAEGYGSQFAKYDANASDEERATDRKIAVSPRK